MSFPSVINAAWLRAIGQSAPIRKLAMLAGYSSALPTRGRNSATRMGTNSNSTYSQFQRTQLQWDGEYVGKNSPLGVAYLATRLMYCSPDEYIPDTGDAVLDQELADALRQRFAHGGIDCSTQTAFSRVSHVAQPSKGDSALVWYRDETQYRQMEVDSDQIGELYQLTSAKEWFGDDGQKLLYFCGKFLDPLSGITRGYRIYDRGQNDYYSNPRNFPASDVLYFQDNLFRGVRGVTMFHAVIDYMRKSDMLFQSGMDSANKQAKTAAVVFNANGMADSDEYEGLTDQNGELTYVEKTFDGPVTEFRYSGDAYQMQQTQSPGPELIEGCRYADERACLGLRFPYSFLVNANLTGGASSRLEINKAGKEIVRLKKLDSENLFKTSAIHIFDLIERDGFPKHPNILRGSWRTPNLPIADAFREDKQDIESLHAGTTTRGKISASNGSTYRQDLLARENEAFEILTSVDRVNERLKAAGSSQVCTQDNIAQDKDTTGQSQPLPVTISSETKSEPLIATIGIGGTQALVQIQQQIASGVLDRETGIATLINVFGISRAQAESMAPQKGSAQISPEDAVIAKVTPSGDVGAKSSPPAPANQ